MIDGIQPVPVALPAARVKIPAPATLLAKLKIDVAIDDLLVLSSDGILQLPLPIAFPFSKEKTPVTDDASASCFAKSLDVVEDPPLTPLKMDP
mmetsp:Transcript_26745/g.40449  ORF Transcript_26745/g.40449 Transcript_26745/m.40449 type:complete len:93 (+) Transcript_26745:2834-3112(+)